MERFIIKDAITTAGGNSKADWSNYYEDEIEFEASSVEQAIKKTEGLQMEADKKLFESFEDDGSFGFAPSYRSCLNIVLENGELEDI